jgi:hypothetical protein
MSIKRHAKKLAKLFIFKKKLSTQTLALYLFQFYNVAEQNWVKDTSSILAKVLL